MSDDDEGHKENKAEKRVGSANGGRVSVFNKMCRKTSLDGDISAGHEKRGERERARQRVRDRGAPWVQDAGVTSEQKAFLWHTVKEAKGSITGDWE